MFFMNSRINEIIQDCNLNFLLGSGLSCPYLQTLGNIEALLTQLAENHQDSTKAELIRASLYKKYFDEALGKNLKILQSDIEANEVLANYCNFLKILNEILLKRKSTILGKEANIFTTNVDIFLEKAFEALSLECNDGFSGRFRPTFSLNNFKKSQFKKSLHYDNVSEIPVFNLVKLHGALTWQLDENGQIVFSPQLDWLRAAEGKCGNLINCIKVENEDTIEKLLMKAQDLEIDKSVQIFMDEYEKLLIVNPTKEKFRLTILNQNYYELLRIYSNELEKENTVLFVMGFSFADEHIRDVTLRAANSNPTLMIYIMAHTKKAKLEMEKRFEPKVVKNSNVEILSPQDDLEDASGGQCKYDLATINEKILGAVLEEGDDVHFPEEYNVKDAK
jgi:hypothetical protein